jgi:hypothetical protein
MTMELSRAIRPRQAGKVDVAVWDLIQWAFQRECAQVEFDGLGLDEVAPPAFGMEYVLLERARLGGMRIDGGGRSPCHPDADVVAAALATLPDSHGGHRMALSIAELARAGQVPDCMANARPRIEPVAWRQSKHGPRAQIETVGVEVYQSRGRWRQVERKACPVRYAPSQAEIMGARRRYLAWWGALLHIRQTLQLSRDLTAFAVTDTMPAMEPWKKPLTKTSPC